MIKLFLGDKNNKICVVVVEQKILARLIDEV